MDFVKNINADRENTDAFTEKLWMGIQNGDKDCYEKLFNEYSDKMLAYGMKYTTDRDLIKECIQSVFVYIFVNRKKLAAVHNTSGYLLASFRHELFHSLNERSSRFSYLEEMPEFKLEVKFASQHIEKMDDESLKVRSQLIKAIDNDYAVMWYDILLAYGRYTGGNTEYNHLPNGARVIVLKEGKREFSSWIRVRTGEIEQSTVYPNSFKKDDWRKRKLTK